MAADVDFSEKVYKSFISSVFPDVTGLGNHKCFSCFSIVVGTTMNAGFVDHIFAFETYFGVWITDYDFWDSTLEPL